MSILNTYIIDFDAINNIELGFIRRYGYMLDKNRLAFTVDNSSFMNHSDSPNVMPLDLSVNNVIGDVLIASRPIQHGEELTINYRIFDIREHYFTKEKK